MVRSCICGGVKYLLRSSAMSVRRHAYDPPATLERPFGFDSFVVYTVTPRASMSALD